MAATINGVQTTTARDLVVADEITLGEGTGERMMTIDGGDSNRGFWIKNNGSQRWQIISDSSDEDFEIHWYNDSGSWQGQAFLIDRTDGKVYLNTGLHVGDGAESALEVILECDSAGTADLIFRADADNSAALRLNADDDLVWRRYNPKGTYQDDAVTFDSSTGDIATGDIATDQWSNYYSSSTVVGFSSMTSSVINYKRFGKLVFVQLNLTGTSDTTTLTFTLPYSTRSDEIMVHSIKYIDAGTWGTTPGSVQLGISDSGVSAYTDMDAAAWTASGSKGIQGNFWYEAA
jgi:hypothetical protein